MIEVKRNRRLSTNPKSGYFWCYKCDRHTVASGMKCPLCRAKPVRKSFKKAVGTDKHII